MVLVSIDTCTGREGRGVPIFVLHQVKTFKATSSCIIRGLMALIATRQLALFYLLNFYLLNKDVTENNHFYCKDNVVVLLPVLSDHCDRF